MLPTSGSYPGSEGCSQRELKPYTLHSSSSSPTAQHGPEVLPKLASQQEAPQEKFPWQGVEGFSNKENRKGSHLRISDLIRSEYARGRHLPNCHFTSLSSGVRSGRIPEGSATKANLRT